MNEATAVVALAALAHPTRLAAFRALVVAGPEGIPVGTLRDALEVPPATLSAHLNTLREAGLARDRRDGRVIFVSADFARMNALLEFLTRNCCAGSGSCGPVPRSRTRRKP